MAGAVERDVAAAVGLDDVSAARTEGMDAGEQMLALAAHAKGVRRWVFEEDQRFGAGRAPAAIGARIIGDAMLHRERVVVGDDAGPEEGDAGSQTAVLSGSVNFGSAYHKG